MADDEKIENAAAPEGGEPSPDLAGRETELERTKKEREEYLNGWKRAKADLINYQKDEGKRFEEVMKFGITEVVRDFIPVLDSLDLAIEMLKEDGAASKGVYMIKSQLEDVLRKRGLEKMKISLGEEFSPSVHESVGEIESEHAPGSIGEVIEQGYTLSGRVVRPARVKLAKTKNN